MRTVNRIILYSLLIFIVSTLGITYWYIAGHLEYDAINFKFFKVGDIQFKSLIDVIVQIGFVGALIPTFLFSIIYFLKMRMKNVGLFYILAFISIVFASVLVYQFILYTIFHHFGTPISFK